MENLYLTKAEEQIMQLLWQLEKAYVKDIIELMPTPKPAYNTVSTIIRILEDKGFVGHSVSGKSHQYYPVVAKSEYTRSYFRNFLGNYFGNSFQQMVSFFANEKEITAADLDAMLEIMKKTTDNNNVKK